MKLADVPENEAERLASLDSFELSREREARYNELVELAAFVAHTPMATISVVEENEIWFKGSIGLEVDGIERPTSICGHTVNRDRMLVIPDTLLDDRFHDNPLVVDPPNVRFYAGTPLIVDDGLAVGTLCVLDTRPRTFLTDERRALQIIANQVVTQLRTDRLARQVAEAR